MNWFRDKKPCQNSMFYPNKRAEIMWIVGRGLVTKEQSDGRRTVAVILSDNSSLVIYCCMFYPKAKWRMNIRKIFSLLNEWNYSKQKTTDSAACIMWCQWKIDVIGRYIKITVCRWCTDCKHTTRLKDLVGNENLFRLTKISLIKFLYSLRNKSVDNKLIQYFILL